MWFVRGTPEDLVVYPERVGEEKRAGAWKDLQSTVSQLEAFGRDVRLMAIKKDDPRIIASDLRRGSVSRVILYYSCFPKLARYIRRTHPEIMVVVRAVNAEGLQDLHRRGLNRFPDRRYLRDTYVVARSFARDMAIRRNSDFILSINQWEIDHYWRWLPGRARLLWLPYVVSQASPPTHWSDRRAAILCLSSLPSRLGLSMMAGFGTLRRSAARLGSTSELQYLVSEGIGGAPMDLPWGCEAVRVDDAFEFLGSVRAVAVLGDLGFGMKTTIIDGIAAGCHVLVHPAWARRLPRVIANACIIVDPHDDDSVATGLSTISVPPSRHSNAMRELQSVGRLTLKEVFS